MKICEYPRLKERIVRQTLKNGLEVMVVEKPGYSKSFAAVAVRYGGMDMRFRTGGLWRDTPAGVAHYLEHKMYDIPNGNAALAFSKSGAEDNAFTSCTTTAYYFSCTENFYDNLHILLSYIAQPYFTRESVDKEQGIISQEIRMGDDDPGLQIHLNLLTCLYEKHPVRVPVIGSQESIRHITPQVLYDCYNAFYTPSNMVLVAAGNMEPERIVAIVEECLPDKDVPAIERAPIKEEPPFPAQRKIEKAMEVSMPAFLAGYKCHPVLEGETYLRERILGDLASDALFGESSVLFHRLYREGAVSGSLDGGIDLVPGAAYTYVGGDAKDPVAVFEEITAQAARLGQEGIEENFYQQLRRGLYGQMLRGLDSFENIALSLAEGYFEGYDYYRFPEIFDSIKKTDIEAFLRDHYSMENAAVSIIKPLEKT